MPGGVFAGLGTTSFSTNPHNLETYDYYNNPASPGYPGLAAWTRGEWHVLPRCASSAVRVSTCSRRMCPDAGNADYLELRNVDWRSATDSSYFVTKFQQGSISLEQDIGDQLTVDVLYGKSKSTNDNQAFLVEFNRMDSPETFVYDERAHGSMPTINYGFDVADPNNWSLVKGFSVLRHFLRETDNEYEGGHLNFDLKLTDNVGIEFGYTRREYKFAANEGQRLSQRTDQPDSRRAGRHCRRTWAASMISATVWTCRPARRVRSSRRTSMPSARPSASIATASTSTVTSGCRTCRIRATSSGSTNSTPAISCRSTTTSISAATGCSATSGSATRKPRLESSGLTTNVAATGPRPLVETNEYNDDLPSFNVAFELTPDLLVRVVPGRR